MPVLSHVLVIFKRDRYRIDICTRFGNKKAHFETWTVSTCVQVGLYYNKRESLVKQAFRLEGHRYEAVQLYTSGIWQCNQTAGQMVQHQPR
jgi:hypothetical protein